MTSQAGTGINKYIILVISTTTSFIMPFLVASVNIAIPTISREFALEAWIAAWVGTVYFLSIAMVQVPFGRLADIYGRKKLFIFGLLLTILASILGALANSIVQLFISLALVGMGSGIIFNNSISILTSVFPAEQRGRALGISTAGTYTGLSMGPFIGGVLTRTFGWQSIFILSGLLSVVLLALVFYALKGEWREAAGERFDIIGSITYAISIALFIYGFSSLPSVLGIIIFILGVVGLTLFARWESRTESPIFNVKLFKTNRVFLFSNLAVFISYIATFAVSFLLSLYLQYIKDLTPDAAGLILITASILMAIFTPISGWISDRIEPRLVASVGMSLNCVALFLLIFVGVDTSLWFIIFALAINGLGIGIFASPNTNAIMGAVEKKSLGVAAGTLGTMRTAGMMVSMGIMMILFSLYIGQTEITTAYYPQFLSSVRTGFIIFTVFSVFGLFCQMVARSADKSFKSR
ncbi:MAG: MFS transporter [Chloroflexi bacterium RBG_13_51_52]|nr:MAG: MFS transporter [Chloroflexi bacterium RBG_13_51_52]